MAIQKNKMDKEASKKFVDTQILIQCLEASVFDCETKISMVQDAITTAILKSPEREMDIRSLYHQRLVYLVL